jgi:hypothetical protein
MGRARHTHPDAADRQYGGAMGEVRVHATERIERPATEVLAVLRDIAAQHEWMPGQYRSDPLEVGEDGLVSRALIGNDVKVAKDEFEVVYSHDAGTAGYTWTLASPSTIQRSHSGAWRLTELGPEACEARLELTIDSTLPVPGFILRKAIQDTASGSVRALRARCGG